MVEKSIGKEKERRKRGKGVNEDWVVEKLRR